MKLVAISAVVLCLCMARESRAQYVHDGSQFVGATVGINFNDGDVPIGVNYEYNTRRDVGIGGVFRYWTRTTFHFSDGGTYVWTSYLIGAQGNYHFKVPQREIDPFLGAILGYSINQGAARNTIYTSYSSQSAPSNFIFAIQAGTRYFIADNFALVGKLVFGSGSYNVIEIGGDFGL